MSSELQDEIDDFSALKRAFDPAFQSLKEKARIKLKLPSSASQPDPLSFIRRMRDSVNQKQQEYIHAVEEYEVSGETDLLHAKEIMRISYNFAEDAIKILQLLVSISDLKAVLLWCTVKEHFDVSEAFRNLPWTRSDRKPSLDEYQKTISGARNSAFHNLFAFDRTIEADLEGVPFTARRLTLLPAHSLRKSTIFFEYDDREVVEVLTALSRAPESAVPLEFWKKNTAVMASFEKLLERTETALWILHRALTQDSR